MLSSIRRVAIAMSVAIACVAATPAAHAQDLTIGLGIPITSLDPHFANNSPNKAVARHFFEALVAFDEKLDLVPALATSWKRTSDTVWEIQLRPGVKFSDGSTLDANDVVASFARAPVVPNSPASLALFTRSIKAVTAIDASRVRIETKYPDPLLPTMLPEILIIPSELKDATTADYNTGKTMVGTGPFIFESYTPGDRVVMRRNDNYWGTKADWAHVQLRFITNDAARVAALLANDVQLIENVPPDLVERVKSNANFHFVPSPPVLPVYIGLDVGGETTAHVTPINPAPGAKANPLQDKRVRQALSYAIDRKAISERIQQNTTSPAGQLLLDGLFGTSSKVKPPAYDPEKAKALLAEAGYKNGIDLTFNGPNDRYANDSRVVQAIAQMWNRVGINAKAEVMPWSIYFPKAGKREFSIWLLSSGSISEMATALNSVVVTYDPKNGRGVNNRGRYSNPKLDDLVNTAFNTLDDTKRRNLLIEASELTADEMPVIPLYFYSFTIATTKDLKYTPRLDQFTLAQGAHRAK
jgi:peptide/nickel transport system substrate-binding protein